MLADEIFRIYSDESFASALWARLEFRAVDSICGIESGVDPSHTCLCNPLPEPSPACSLLAQERLPSAAKWRFCRESKGTVVQQGHMQQELPGLLQTQHQHVQHAQQLHPNTIFLISLGSCRVQCSNAASCFWTQKQIKPLCHPQQTQG